MKELSLHILDIVQNSVKAQATLINMNIEETADTLTFTVTDDGCGMSPEFLRNVIDPFTTTRTTRKVGLGIPLLKLMAEQTGGSISIISDDSPERHGTTTGAVFIKTSIDYTPLGDMVETLCTLIQGSPDIDFVYCHSTDSGQVTLDTRELREVLGDVSLASIEVLSWIKESLREEYLNL